MDNIKKKAIRISLQNGILSDEKKNLLLRKAVEEGLTPQECEITIEAKLKSTDETAQNKVVRVLLPDGTLTDKLRDKLLERAVAKGIDTTNITIVIEAKLGQINQASVVQQPIQVVQQPAPAAQQPVPVAQQPAPVAQQESNDEIETNESSITKLSIIGITVILVILAGAIFFIQNSTTKDQSNSPELESQIISNSQVKQTNVFIGYSNSDPIILTIEQSGSNYSPTIKPMNNNISFNKITARTDEYNSLILSEEDKITPWCVLANYSYELTKSWDSYNKLIMRIDSNIENKSIAELTNIGKEYFANRNYLTSLKYFTLGAFKGDPFCQIKVGAMYEQAQGVTQNYTIAFNWFVIAAQCGYAEAEYYVGDMIEYGKGTTRNFESAINWYRSAAAKGSLGAATRLRQLGR